MGARNNVCPKLCLGGEVQNNFHIICILVRTPFIHLLGSSLVQWMMVRFSGKEKPKHDLQVRLGEASLCLGEEVCLGRVVRLGEEVCLGRVVRLGEACYS